MIDVTTPVWKRAHGVPGILALVATPTFTGCDGIILEVQGYTRKGRAWSVRSGVRTEPGRRMQVVIPDYVRGMRLGVIGVGLHK